MSSANAWAWRKTQIREKKADLRRDNLWSHLKVKAIVVRKITSRKRTIWSSNSSRSVLRITSLEQLKIYIDVAKEKFSNFLKYEVIHG